jgi:hypothetical protein
MSPQLRDERLQVRPASPTRLASKAGLSAAGAPLGNRVHGLMVPAQRGRPETNAGWFPAHGAEGHRPTLGGSRSRSDRAIRWAASFCDDYVAVGLGILFQSG